MSNWVKYKNGNYNVKFNLDDGTKIRETDEDKFIASFAENSDVCLTKKCSQNCSFCYEGCTSEGKHSDIMNQKWIHSLHPYTELAINGNDLDHPQLDEFLEFLKDKKIIANMTVNQNQFMNNLNKIKSYIDNKLIYGLGVSLINPTDKFICEIKKFKNAVIHVINGIVSAEDIEKLANNNLKLLILGYKELNRGVDYIDENRNLINSRKTYLYMRLNKIISLFDVVSFDNLALEQLNVKRLLTQEQWDEFFMGTDGSATFYIDAVNETFSKNSIASEDERYQLLDTVDEMFERIKVR